MPDATVVLGLDVPNLLPESVLGARLDWLRPAGRLLWSSLFVLAGIAVVLLLCRRPKSPEPVTWAGAMLGAIAVFALMLLGYGVVPHEWLTFAASYLNWGADRFAVRRNAILPFDVTLRVVADTIEVLIYAVMVTVNILLFSLWQKRPVRQPAEEPAEPAARAERGTSAYGRPVTTGG